MSEHREQDTGTSEGGAGELIRVVLVDDHPVVREGLEAMLGLAGDIEVVGQFGDGARAIQEIPGLGADVILLDLQMPEPGGLEVISALEQLEEGPRVLVFTAFDSDELLMGALRLGVAGYLLKGVPRQELFGAIRAVAAGGSSLGPEATARLMQTVAEPQIELTPREKEVLEALSRGLTNRELGQLLYISERTVKFHVSSILGKLGAENRTEAVSLAVQMGLVTL